VTLAIVPIVYPVKKGGHKGERGRNVPVVETRRAKAGEPPAQTRSGGAE
jgi:hypothetical protein